MGFRFPLRQLEDESWMDAAGRVVPDFPNDIGAAWQGVERTKQHLPHARMDPGMLMLLEMDEFYVATFGHPDVLDEVCEKLPLEFAL